ncbi:MAG: two-component system sensor protein [Glaciihabitans sp.]|nr:two-component system sensor protein [Glaciihabitans sp.]
MKLEMPRQKWTLRRRLVVSIVALVMLMALGTGAASIVGLDRYLVQQVDRQLSVAQSNNSLGRNGPSGGPFGGDYTATDVLGRGLPINAFALVVEDGTIISSGIIGLLEDEQPTLTEAQVDRLFAVELDSGGASVNLGSTFGTYRVIAYTLPNGNEAIVGLPLSEVESTVSQYRGFVILISALGVVLVALASFFIVSLALRPLRRVAATATQVASLPLDRGEVDLSVRVPDEDTDPRTEVGQVGAAFNGMLGHVDAALRSRQASENKVRQFVADASHELRTPLASIRGYAELTRRSGHTLPVDVSHSMARVESEAVRMTSLVEDLLLLARLDEGRELEKQPVNLGNLLVDCISDAYAAGPEHDWDLDAPDEGIVVPGDQQRIHQVFANLLTNARVHTPEGTRVAVRLFTTDAGAAVVTITDNGPGIAESVQATLFERFARADSSRSRLAGSTGLGLSIVQAVVTAHGGSVSVSSTPGATEFRVELPRATTRSSTSQTEASMAD